MKKLLLLVLFPACCYLAPLHAQGVLGKIKDKAKNKVSQRADQKLDNAMDKTLDSIEHPQKNENDDAKSKQSEATPGQTAKPPGDSQPPALKVYQNYDFVPGDKILFEDDFADDQDGEFPSHWELLKGQAVLNKIGGAPAFHLTEGNYVRVQPRMKTAAYLTDPFTIEYDYYYVPGAYGLMVMLLFNDKEAGYEKEHSIQVSEHEAGFSNGGDGLQKQLPAALGENMVNRWHHVAIAYKNGQIKVYVDQFRVLVVPDAKAVYEKIQFAGIGDETKPMVFRNVRVASGGSMNMIGKKFTDSKIVTHGINFDIDRATVRPESMGTLNMIVTLMKDNPELRFQIGGHTDDSGNAAHNLSLSQQRAEAVKKQLESMGVDPSRLTTKGFGDTKPISANTTPEGKANNRRVEFVKI